MYNVIFEQADGQQPWRKHATGKVQNVQKEIVHLQAIVKRPPFKADSLFVDK